MERLAGAEMTDVRLTEASITEDMIEQMRAKIGLQLRIDHSVNNEDATRLAIAKFAQGIGDPNPLWTDPAYAGRSPYGSLVAPPSWVICCFAGLQFGWPGLGSFHSSSDLTFHAPVLLGDRVTATCTYDGFDGPRPSTFARQVVVDRFHNRYINGDGHPVADIRWQVMNFERQTARRQRAGHQPVELPHRWTAEALAAIEEEVLAERPRGAEPRYWDDVEIGDPLDQIVKGPIGITDEIAFVAAGGAPIPRLSAHGYALREYRRHPDWAFRDPTTSALEPIYAVHYNRHAAQAMGVAMEYDVGFQRQCWQIHLLTNWAGDDGWIKSASAQYRSFVHLSDVVRLGGRVEAKNVDDDGDSVVVVSTSATNQRGANVMPGSATIALPSRRGGSPAVRRVRARISSLFSGR